MREQGAPEGKGMVQSAGGFQVQLGGYTWGSGVVNPSGDRQDREILHVRPVNPLILRGGIEVVDDGKCGFPRDFEGGLVAQGVREGVRT